MKVRFQRILNEILQLAYLQHHQLNIERKINGGQILYIVVYEAFLLLDLMS